MIDLKYVQMLEKRNSDIREHIMFLYIIPFSIGAKVIVELGAGQSSFALTAVANVLDANVYSFDIEQKSITRYFPEDVGILEKESRFHFTLGDDRITISSWSLPIDVLFIDTSHVYEHTLWELENWGKYVRDGGIIMMHDTSDDVEMWTDCRKAKNEWLEKYNYPCIQYNNQNGFSIIRKIIK